MSNYTKATNFAVKDGLTTGDPSKRIKGTEIDTEYNAIASAISSKADSNSPTFTGTPLAPTAAGGTNTTQIATTAFVNTERSATATLTNKTISVDDNTVSGIAASSFVVSNSSGNIDGSASQKAIPSGIVVGTTDTQTLTNKTIALGSNTVSGTKAQFNTAVTDTDFSFINDFTGSNQSLSTSGYQKFPGGLIIQWGTNSDTNVAINFPIEFPNAGLSMTASVTPTGDQGADATVEIVSKSQFKLRCGSTTGNNNIHWIAIGY